MAKILVYTTPARGHLYPITPTLLELQRRGHEIVLRTLASQVPPMRELGFDAAPVAPEVESLEHDDYTGRTAQAGLKLSIAVFAQRAKVEVPDVQAAIASEQPDLVLADGGTWGGLAVAEASGLPWASWLPYPMPITSRDVPPFGPGLPPARGPLGRARDAVLRPLLLAMFSRILLPPLNGVRAELGLPALSDPNELFSRPPAMLYLTSEPFEYPRSDWPPNIKLIGAGVWDPPAEPPAWLAHIDRPIVLVTTSSEFQDDGRLVETALDALADEPVHVVATLPAGDPSAFAPRPNATIVRFVPHAAVLERAVCAVTHGGMGATQKALAAGVPVCAVPFGRDQLEVARRVAVAGAGTRLSSGKLRPDRLRAAVRAATTMTAGAQRVAAGYRAAGGAPAGADHIERLLAGAARRQTVG